MIYKDVFFVKFIESTQFETALLNRAHFVSVQTVS
jgi:hypothetical protein